MVKADLINDGNWDEITRLTKEAVNAMLGFELEHIGVNCENEDEAMQTAKLFELAFGFGIANGSSSIFCGKRYIELMKAVGRGKNGHIAILTNSLSRAVAHLKARGFQFDEANAMQKNGKTIGMYFEQEFAGFGVHLLQK